MMKFTSLFAGLMLAWACVGALHAAPGGSGGQAMPLNGQGAQSGAFGAIVAAQGSTYARDTLGIGPATVSITDPLFGGHGQALRAATHYGTSGTAVDLFAGQILNVSITSAGGNTATVSPAWVVPTITALGAVGIYASNVGASGAQVSAQLTSSNPTTGVITIANGGTFAAVSGVSSQLVIRGYSTETNSGVYMAGRDYGTIGVSNLTTASGAVYGSQIILQDPMLPYLNSSSALPGLVLCIESAPSSIWCGKIVDDSNNTQGTTVSVVGFGVSSAAYPTTGSITARVTWAPFLFRPDDASACSSAGRGIEVPQASSTTDSLINTIQQPFEGTISTVIEPLAVTLTSAVTSSIGATSAGAVDGIMVTGCDDTAAYIAAVKYAQFNPNRQEVANSIYLPSDTFLQSATSQNFAYFTQVLSGGEGTLIFPTNGIRYYHGAAQFESPRDLRHALPDTADIDASVNFVHLEAIKNGCITKSTGYRCTAQVDVVGNSPGVEGENAAGFMSNRATRVCDWFRDHFRPLQITCISRAVGGTQFAQLDPGGWTNGYVPQLAVAFPAWYTNFALPWLSGYVEPDDPDVIVFGFADQESTSISFAAITQTIGYTQTTAWASTTGWNPDIVLMPWPWQPTTFGSQSGTNFAAAMQRSYARACVTKLANGGCVGLFDVSRFNSFAVDGYDPERLPMRHFQALPVYSQGLLASASSFSLTTALLAMSTTPKFRSSAAQSSEGALFSAAGYEFDFTIGAASMAVPQTLSSSGRFVTVSASSGASSVQVGYAACWMAAGDAISGSGIPAGDVINSVSGCNSTATIGLVSPLTGTLSTGNTIVVTQPGPNLGYPGQILRVYKDQTGVAGGGNTGNVAYRFDTVYTPTLAATCSASTSTPNTVTCTTPQIGNWHRGLYLSIPGAGSSQCPNPSGAANCAIGTISTVAFTGALAETVTLATSPITTSVSNVQPIIYRTSIPYTVSSRAAENLTGNCYISTYAYLGLGVEFRGSKLLLSYCDSQLAPGPSKIFDNYLERWDGPFIYSITSPNGLTGAQIYMGIGPSFAALGPSGGTAASNPGSASPWFAADPVYPTVEPWLRIGIDIFAPGPGVTYSGPNSWPYGGQYAAHQGTMGEAALDDVYFAGIRP
jgi:hypothetical protein